jgi:hypothetical protein
MDKDNDMLMNSIDDRIETFLRGSMSAEEETAFRQEIKSNPELRNRVMTMVSLVKGVRAKESERVNNAINSVVKSNQSKLRPVLWWACSVAAVFAIFFGVYKDRRYNMLDATVSPYYTQYNITDISRGETDSVTIVHLYNLFTQIQEKRNVSDVIKELEPIYISLDEDFTYNAYANDISWNLALAYVKDDQIDKAITILQKLKADNPDTPIYNKADELIKKLQDL